MDPQRTERLPSSAERLIGLLLPARKRVKAVPLTQKTLAEADLLRRLLYRL